MGTFLAKLLFCTFPKSVLNLKLLRQLAHKLCSLPGDSARLCSNTSPPPLPVLLQRSVVVASPVGAQLS